MSKQKLVKAWDIEVFCRYANDNYDDLIGFSIFCNKKLSFKISRADAEDCTEAMGIIGKYILHYGFPEKCIPEKQMTNEIINL